MEGEVKKRVEMTGEIQRGQWEKGVEMVDGVSR